VHGDEPREEVAQLGGLRAIGGCVIRDRFRTADVIDPNDATRHATGVYVGLNVVLPVGIPLANSGLGIFGFRGIFGMHYARNATLGGNTAAPALGWLQATEGQPHLIQSPTLHNILWKPQIDNWTFGVGVLMGTMEGGFVLNLDGTLLLELPGPRVAVVMNARIITPPPSVGEMGNKGGILATDTVREGAVAFHQDGSADDRHERKGMNAAGVPAWTLAQRATSWFVVSLDLNGSGVFCRRSGAVVAPGACKSLIGARLRM